MIGGSVPAGPSTVSPPRALHTVQSDDLGILAGTDRAGPAEKGTHDG